MVLVSIIHARKIEFVPIIYAFVGKTSRHILVFDQASQEVAYAREVQQSIQKLYQKYALDVRVEMIKIDEDSKKDMQMIAKKFAQIDDILYLNGTGADLALFTVLSSLVLRQNGKVVAYDKDDNSYNLITQNGFVNEQIETSMNLDDFLILMGEELIEEVSTAKILKQADDLNLIFSDMKRMYKVRQLLKEGKTEQLMQKYPKIMKSLKKLGIVDVDNQLKGQMAYTGFGYLFEAFIYLQMRVFEYDDIKVGAKIRFDKRQVATRDIEVRNEFDILLINENKIGFIECKIGDSHDPLATVYKSDSIMEYFGENASSMIINLERDKSPHMKESKRQFSPSVIYRAETKRVIVYNAFDFSPKVFKQKVQKAFGLHLKKEYVS